MKLYELTGAFNEIFDSLESDDELNFQALEDTLQAIEGVIEQKASSIAKIIKSLEKSADAFDSESKRLADKKKSTENKIKWLKDYLLQAMELTAKDKIFTDIGTVARQKSPASVSVLDIEKIPKEYWYIPVPAPILDKKLILDTIKRGTEVPGAALHQGYHIRIR
ncbi:MAG: hypothetical protein C4589_11155 [Peptococcaceae bacterium]|nr:MAG: hypothetical protein C4589_11155 [Peptococcaceae bacterium]